MEASLVLKASGSAFGSSSFEDDESGVGGDAEEDGVVSTMRDVMSS